MIGDDKRRADIVRARAGELVILRRARARERDADVGQILDAGAQRQRRSDTHPERIDA